MTIAKIEPRNNLLNIPHMLRNLASEIEDGATPSPLTLFIVLVYDESEPPALFQFGKELSRYAEVGAMQACVHMMLQIDEG